MPQIGYRRTIGVGGALLGRQIFEPASEAHTSIPIIGDKRGTANAVPPKDVAGILVLVGLHSFHHQRHWAAPFAARTRSLDQANAYGRDQAADLARNFLKPGF